MLGLHKDKVELHPYDEQWAIEFQKEKQILQGLLSGIALDIQHVGSTSIPGISAKPIIDIAVAVKDLGDLEKVIPVLQNAGYDVKNSIEDKGEVLGAKGSPECRTHYIHIEPQGSEYWNNHILFRDYLLNHPEYISQYETMKQGVLEQFKERKLYTAHKNDFIKKILDLAKQEKDAGGNVSRI
ncbi:MAG: GrpB family protein [Clostridia bacterium]|nr:GrpB family protein [Clostridia bacterium]